MLTLTYGQKLPETGDRGSVFFPALEDNITRIDAHTHDGSNTPKISVANLTKLSQTLSSASWVSLGGGNYRQLVTMPTGATMADSFIRFEIASGANDGDLINLSVKWASTNTYYAYINDNSIDVRAVYI